MSVSMLRTGIVKSGGTGIGPNLVLNGNGLGGYTGTTAAPSWWNMWHSGNGRLPTDLGIVNRYGKTWLHFKSFYAEGNTAYSGFNQYSNGTGTGMAVKPNTNYTISATWFSSENTTGCYWVHMRSSEGGYNLNQRTGSFEVLTSPKRLYWTFNSGSDSTYTINRFNLMIGAYYPTSSTDVYITDIKMEEGSIATPYIPNENDPWYVSGQPGFIEVTPLMKTSGGRDWMSAECFYEI